MSKSKRRIQARKRAANVHRYCVQQGLIECVYGGCPDCEPSRTSEAAKVEVAVQ